MRSSFSMPLCASPRNSPAPRISRSFFARSKPSSGSSSPSGPRFVAVIAARRSDSPAFDTAEPRTSSNFDTTGVLKGCKYPDRAAEFAAWLSSSKESLTALTDPASKSGLFPAVKDVSPYVDKIIPTEMFNGKSDSAQVITTAASRVGEQWQYGPNYAAMYSEMQKQWGQVMKKQLTVKDMLTSLQKWTVDDLNRKGIKAVAGS